MSRDNTHITRRGELIEHSEHNASSHRALARVAAIGALLIVAFNLSGCLAAAAGGAGYAIGHEQGEDHVQEGTHIDDD